MKYPPIFKRIQVNPDVEGKAIRQMQEEFERFWPKVSRFCQERSSEKTMAMRKLQEGCMWLSRAIALQGFPNPDEPFVATMKNCSNADLSAFNDQPAGTVLVATSSHRDGSKKTVILKKKHPQTPSSAE